MRTKQFLPVAQNLIETGLFSILEKGERGQYLLGGIYLGRTDSQNTKLWRNYGTLENIVIFETAEKANEILADHGITEFKAKSTKSGTMSRLIINK